MKKTAVVMFSRLFDVDICHDHEDNVWVAQCDALSLVTEAATYEELTERVWVIAPINGLGSNPAHISLSFSLNCEDEGLRNYLQSEHC